MSKKPIKRAYRVGGGALPWRKLGWGVLGCRCVMCVCVNTDVISMASTIFIFKKGED